MSISKELSVALPSLTASAAHISGLSYFLPECSGPVRLYISILRVRACVHRHLRSPFSGLSVVRPILLPGLLHLRPPLEISVQGVSDLNGHPVQFLSSAKTYATPCNTFHPLELVANLEVDLD